MYLIAADEFLSQAKWLLHKDNASEADFRTAISRAYYGLFHESYRFLKDKYKDKTIGEIIRYVLSKDPFYTMTSEDIQKIGELDNDYLLRLNVNFHQLVVNVLRSLNYHYFMKYKRHRKDRNLADYNLEIGINYECAKDKIESILNLITLIKNL